MSATRKRVEELRRAEEALNAQVAQRTLDQRLEQLAWKRLEVERVAAQRREVELLMEEQERTMRVIEEEMAQREATYGSSVEAAMAHSKEVLALLEEQEMTMMQEHLKRQLGVQEVIEERNRSLEVKREGWRAKREALAKERAALLAQRQHMLQPLAYVDELGNEVVQTDKKETSDANGKDGEQEGEEETAEKETEHEEQELSVEAALAWAAANVPTLEEELERLEREYAEARRTGEVDVERSTGIEAGSSGYDGRWALDSYREGQRGVAEWLQGLVWHTVEEMLSARVVPVMSMAQVEAAEERWRLRGEALVGRREEEVREAEVRLQGLEMLDEVMEALAAEVVEEVQWEDALARRLSELVLLGPIMARAKGSEQETLYKVYQQMANTRAKDPSRRVLRAVPAGMTASALEEAGKGKGSSSGVLGRLWGKRAKDDVFDPMDDEDDGDADVFEDDDGVDMIVLSLEDIGRLSAPAMQQYRALEAEYWKSVEFRPRFFKTANGKGVACASVSPCGKYMASCDTEGQLYVYSMEEGSEGTPLRVAKSWDERIKKRKAQTIRPKTACTELCWSVDSMQIAGVAGEAGVVMWSVHPDAGYMAGRDTNLEDKAVPMTRVLEADAEALATVARSVGQSLTGGKYEEEEEEEGDKGEIGKGKGKGKGKAKGKGKVKGQEEQDAVVDKGAGRVATTAFHNSMTLFGTQPSVMCGLANGDVVKWNGPMSGQAVFGKRLGGMPEMGSDEALDGWQEHEMFKAHQSRVLFVGFVEFVGEMVSVDERGRVFLWEYSERAKSSFGWMEPSVKMRVDLSVAAFAPVQKRATCVWRAGKRVNVSGGEWAEEEVREQVRMFDVEGDVSLAEWVSSSNDGQGRRTRVFVPEVVEVNGRRTGQDGERFPVCTYDERGKLVELAWQRYRSVRRRGQLVRAELLQSGYELALLVFFEEIPPKRARLSLVVLNVRTRKWEPVRVNIGVPSNVREVHAWFGTSPVLADTGSDYVYVLFGNLVEVYSVTTGARVKTIVPMHLKDFGGRVLRWLGCDRRSHESLVAGGGDLSTVFLWRIVDGNREGSEVVAALRGCGDDERRRRGKVGEEQLVRRSNGLTTGGMPIELYVDSLLRAMVHRAVVEVDGEESEVGSDEDEWTDDDEEEEDDDADNPDGGNADDGQTDDDDDDDDDDDEPSSSSFGDEARVRRRVLGARARR